MNNKERLEEIKTIVNYLDGDFTAQAFGYEMKGQTILDDVKWLINRVEELEKEKDEWKDTAQYYYMTNQELREQNKRYRKAIDYIIERVMLFGTNEEVYEAIQDAIKALEVYSD